jgi:hypothetical protein
MPFNGSGTFNRVHNWVVDRGNSVPIRALKMDEEMDGMATGLSTCITKDGQTTTIAAIPFALGVRTGTGSPTDPAYAFLEDATTGIFPIRRPVPASWASRRAGRRSWSTARHRSW